MINRLHIGSPEAADFAAIAELERATHIHTYVGAAPGFTYDVVSGYASSEWAARKEARFRELYKNQEAAMAVARVRDEVVGFSMLHHARVETALSVRPDYQGGVVGLRLVWEVTKHRDSDRGILLTVVPGTAAERFYARLGFVTTGRDITEESPMYPGGNRIPLVELELHPDAAAQAKQKISKLLSGNKHTASG